MPLCQQDDWATLVADLDRAYSAWRDANCREKL